MESPFLTIAEASSKTGRSASTIRRLIHTITESSSHADRSGIEPTTAQVNAYKKKGENFTWKIREDVLTKHFNSAPHQEKSSTSKSQPNVLGILQNELNLKNQQIEKQWEVIHALNERLREGNILMASLQERLALPSPASESDPVVEAPSVVSSMEPSVKSSKKAAKEASKKSSTKATVATAVETTVKKPSRSWLLRWMNR